MGPVNNILNLGSQMLRYHLGIEMITKRWIQLYLTWHILEDFLCDSVNLVLSRPCELLHHSTFDENNEISSQLEMGFVSSGLFP